MSLETKIIDIYNATNYKIPLIKKTYETQWNKIPTKIKNQLPTTLLHQYAYISTLKILQRMQREEQYGADWETQ